MYQSSVTTYTSSPLQLDGVDRHGLDRRHAKWSASSNIEAGTMARALDLAADQFPFGKRATVVGAHIIDRVEFAVDIEHGNRPAVDLDELFAPWRKLVKGCNFHR